MNDTIYKRIAMKFPDLLLKLRQAGMADSPEYFVKKTFMTSIYMTFGILMVLFGFFGKNENKMIMLYIILAMPLVMVFIFLYFMQIPTVKVVKEERSVSKEIVFAGRFLIIEIKSGVNLYDAMLNVAKNFPKLGRSFRNITNKIDLGTTLDESINDEIEITPSRDLRKILWQILNSLRTGADISDSLESVLAQMVRAQVIEVNEYGKKLNPIAMFYMMIAVILPTIGIAMFIVLSTFISLNIELYAMLIIAGFLGFIQFMFVAIIKSKRPAVDL